MTGNDDGGFSPHPGDPWHPGWTPEAEPDEESTSALDPESDEGEGTSKRKRRLFGRRSREAEPIDLEGDEPVAPPPEPEQVAEAEAEGDADTDDPNDPFDAVLRAEGRSVRRRPAGADDAPVPDWTSDQELPDELNLPVTPPSWVGDTTTTDPEVEASGFEPVAPSDAPSEQPDLFTPPESETDDQAAGATPVADAEDADIVDTESADPVSAVAGEYGVAGPEAFGALADTAEEDLGDWEAFMEGAATPDAATEEPTAPGADSGAPAEPLAGGDAFDEWVESEPEQKRRWFRRRKKDPVVEEATWDDEWVDESTPGVDETAFMPPGPGDVDPAPVVETEPDAADLPMEPDPDTAVAEALAALGDAEPDVAPLVEDGEGPVVWADDEGEIAWADEIVGSVADPVVDDSPESEPLETLEVGDSGPATEVLEATDLAELGLEGPVADVDDGGGMEDVAEEPAGASATATLDGVEEATEADEVDDAEEPAGELATDAPFFLGELPEDGDEPAVEEPADWEGDPAQVPSSWFADVDEDTAVPPTVGDTPETEWPTGEGQWEGRTAWETDESTEVFDVEADPVPTEHSVEDASAVDQTPAAPVAPIVPEGYEEWGEAVADATADAGEETAEYHVQHVPQPAQDLPEGFEPFPGSEADVAYGDGSVHPEDSGMPTDDTFEDAPVAYVDDVDGEGPDFDEQIYAGGGTIEHRGLAEAIAAAGDDDTEWQAMSAAMPGVETGVLGFEDVADLADRGDEYVAPVKSNFGMRVFTGLVLAGMLVGSLLLGGWAFALFVSAIVLLGLGELYTTMSRRGYLPLTLFGLVGAAGTLAATWFHGPVAIPAGIMLTGVAVFFFYAFAPTRRDALTNGGVTLLGLAWAVGTIAFAIPIARGADHEVLVMTVVIATAAMDIGAYSFGRRFGKRPLAPILSPNKTVEGLVGGAFVALAAAGAAGFFELGPFDLRSGLALGAIVVVMAPLGDLAESMIKRSMGVKDMGSTLPGHGGVLDRIDALAFVIPGAWVLFEVLGYLG